MSRKQEPSRTSLRVLVEIRPSACEPILKRGVEAVLISFCEQMLCLGNVIWNELNHFALAKHLCRDHWCPAVKTSLMKGPLGIVRPSLSLRSPMSNMENAKMVANDYRSTTSVGAEMNQLHARTAHNVQSTISTELRAHGVRVQGPSGPCIDNEF